MAAGDVTCATAAESAGGKHPPSPIPSPSSKRPRRSDPSPPPAQDKAALGFERVPPPADSHPAAYPEDQSTPERPSARWENGNPTRSVDGDVGKDSPRGSSPGSGRSGILMYKRNSEVSGKLGKCSPRQTPYALRRNGSLLMEASTYEKPKLQDDSSSDLSYVLGIEAALNEKRNGETLSKHVELTEANTEGGSDRNMQQGSSSSEYKEESFLKKDNEVTIGTDAIRNPEVPSGSVNPPVVESRGITRVLCSVVKPGDALLDWEDSDTVVAVAKEQDGVIPGSLLEAASVTVVDCVNNSRLKTAKKKFLLKQLGINFDIASVEDGQDVSQVGRSGRRVTRSMQKDNVENVVPASDLPKPKEIDTPSVKKMEMKMSKKVGLTTPHNVRELLATGLLDGLTVMYIIPNSKRPVLKGIIQDCRITCFCASCNGSKAFSAYNFEVHARSTKKHPSDFIFLENGNALKDVMRLCATAPSDAVEEAIREAIGPLSRKKFSCCFNCSGSFGSSESEKMLCDSCRNSHGSLVLSSSSPASCSEDSLPQPSPYSCSKESTSVRASSLKSIMEGRRTKKDMGLHKLVFKDGFLDNFEVGYFVRGEKVNSGRIKDGGIFCDHCKTVVSPSQFEAHAGQASRKKAYDYTYVIEKGYSLHEIAAEIALRTKRVDSESDSLCCVCGLEENLIGCDRCPRAYHLGCIDSTNRPKDSWRCNYCVILQQKEKALACNRNAIAAGRVAGDNSMEELFTRIVRVVSTDVDPGCTLCKQKDFSKGSFDGRTVLLCDQCQREYHVECLKGHGMADLKELPEGEWFCCESCSAVHFALKEKIIGGAELLENSDLNAIRRKYEMKGLGFDSNNDIRWRVLSGNSTAEDINLLLSKAVEIFHESFDPIVDRSSDSDLIPAMVYGKGDYAGMYCVLLTAGSTVVSVGILRIMGVDIAELPLVATSREFQGLGYFQVLFSCIERMLASLKVQHFVLPAAEKAESIWTTKFGFSRIPLEQLNNYLNGAYWTTFSGTVSLHKLLPTFQSVVDEKTKT